MYESSLLSQIFQETQAFYFNVKQIYNETAYDQKYPLNEFWGDQNMKALLNIIHTESDPVSKIHAVHNTFMFSVNTSNEQIKNRVIDWYLDYFHDKGINLNDFAPHIQESRYSNPANSVSRDGRLLAPDFLRTLILVLEIKENCKLPNHRFNILELGAGYGGLARTLKLFYPNTSYIITDIPESLYFSALFLRLNFPDSKFCYVTEPSKLDEVVANYDFIFLPTIFADNLMDQQFTLFCNTASLGEMKNSVVRYWMNLVQNQAKVKYFFGLNRFLNTIIPRQHPWRLDENICSVSFDMQWKILKWELEPPFTRCPYLETEVTRNLEIIAERLPKEAINERTAQELSQKLIEEVSQQDWFIHYKGDNSMKLRDNILAPNLTMKGTLFSLWESIRLHPNARNVDMMLKYLNTLVRKKPFEEVFYYKDLLSAFNPEPELKFYSTSIEEIEQLQGQLQQTQCQLQQTQAELEQTQAELEQLRLPFPNPMLIADLDLYNILAWRGNYYGLPKGLGPIDLLSQDLSKLPGIVIEQSLEQLTAKLKDSVPNLGNPILVDDFGPYNIIAWKGTCYALPKELGFVDVSSQDISKLKGVLVERSLDKVKRLILNHLVSPLELEQSQTQLQQTQAALEGAHSKIQAIESSKFWKLRQAWFRVKRSLGLNPTPDQIAISGTNS